MPEPPRQTERRERIAAWLRQWSADLAELYLAAVRLLRGPNDVPAHLRLAAHAARELLNRLPDFVAPGERQRVNYRERVDVLRAAIADLPFDGDALSTYVLQGAALDALRQLLADHLAIGDESVERAHRMFTAATRAAQPELLRPLALRWHGLYKLFVHDVHVGNTATASWTESEYRNRFGQVEDVLSTLANDFFAPIAELDTLFADPQTTPDDALGRAVHTEQLRYFFEKLDRPEWVEPLREKGYFASPPLPVLEEGGNFVRYPQWPALGYLVRVAARAPDDVLKAALEVPSTENVTVWAGLLDVAGQLPASLAARLSAKLFDWLRGGQPFHMLIEHRLEPLLAHLAKGGEVDSAEKLVTIASTFLPPQSEYGSPTTRMPTWSYGHLVSTNLPALLDIDPSRFFDRFIALLKRALKVAMARDEARVKRDSSAGWRELVASGPGGIDDPRDILVDAVRDAALRLAADSAETTPVIDRLEQEKFSIFKRIGLHVALERRSVAPEAAAQRVMKRDLFDANEFRREYLCLVQATYPDLDDRQKATWLAWVEQGPDLSYLDGHFIPGEDGRSIQDIKRERCERWQLEKVAVVADSLTGDWKVRYLALTEQYGAPDDPQLPRPHGVWMGPTSPFDTTELKSLGIEMLVAKLQAWVPPEGWMVPSPSGVGRQLAELVAANPSACADTAKFTVLEPTYVRSVVDGFHDGMSANRDVPWEPALALVEWILRQPFVHDVADDFDRDRGWRWARMSAARLLSGGVARRVIPFELRERVWDCIQKLLEDADPTPGDEASRIGHGADAADLSLNATRSVALDAAMHYAVWVRQHVGEEGFSFNRVPELRSALAQRLDPARESSRAVRWVFGRWFRFLVELDRTWATSHVNAVFGIPGDESGLSATAWDAFVSRTVADATSYAILGAHYSSAVDRLARGAPVVKLLNSPDRMVTQHVVRFYWLGLVRFDATDSLIRRFYEVAPIVLRAHLVDFVGRSLHGVKQSDIPEAIAQRLHALWEARIRTLAAWPDTERDAELQAFGWWFAAGNLGAEWLLDELLAVLRLCPRIGSSMSVVERLGSWAVEHTNRSLACLKLMVHGDDIHWSIESWKRHAELVLRAALARAETAADARTLVNELGRRGFHEYRILLGDATA